MTDRNACGICDVNNSKYSCPRCNIPYCSVSCYQSEKHVQCSEVFYEKWVTEELQNCSSDPEAKKKMLEILKQNQEVESEESLDSDDEESTPDLFNRLSNVNLDDEKAVWEKLMPDEKHEFYNLVANGEIIKMLPDKEPWWVIRKRKMLIQDWEESFNWKALCPAVPTDIPALSDITKTKPSPSVPCMILNILESYAFTVRWSKGAYKDLPVEAVSTCIALSATLRNNEIFESALDTLAAFENDLSMCEWVKGYEYKRSIILNDLTDIVKGSGNDDMDFCLKAAISDLNSLSSDAMSVLKSHDTHHLKRFSGPPPKISQLQQISRKMSYYLSWIGDHGATLRSALSEFT